MDEAFKIAREEFPGKQLLYNDYNETTPDKLQKINGVILDMKNRGIPIDAIGMQCHLNPVYPSMDDFKRGLDTYAESGLHIHITELDVSMFEYMDRSHIEKPTNEMIKKQTEIYRQIFSFFREYREVIDVVTLWGAADDMTWLDHFPEPNRKNWPLLFDENYQPKPAFEAIMDF